MESSSNEDLNVNVKAVFFSVEQKCIEKTQIYKITVQFILIFLIFYNISVNMN